jgi:hypothetical protein
MATFYWAWFWPSGDRRAYKQLVDPICAMGIIKRVNDAIAQDDHCIRCHERINGSPEVVVWATIYIPFRERLDVGLPYDAACFEKEADLYSKGGQRLLDRAPAVLLQEGGPPPGAAWDEWDLVHQAST